MSDSYFLYDPTEKPFDDQEVHHEINFSDEVHLLLSCPRCSHFISKDEINAEKQMAKCNHCSHEFTFTKGQPTTPVRPEVLIPEGVEILKLRSELDIRLKWQKTISKAGRNFILLFASIWNLMLLPFVSIIIISGNWGLLLFMSLHLLVGMSMIWYLAATYANKTSISINPRRIRIRTYPIRYPFHKDQELDVRDLAQLYVSKYTQSTSNGVPDYAYALYAIMRDGRRISLVRGMNQDTQQYIEKEMELYLGIVNSKVEGEIR